MYSKKCTTNNLRSSSELHTAKPQLTSYSDSQPKQKSKMENPNPQESPQPMDLEYGDTRSKRAEVGNQEDGHGYDELNAEKRRGKGYNQGQGHLVHRYDGPHHHASAYDADSQTHSYSYGSPSGQRQVQAQAQRFRSAQASQQMLYDVFEHTIGAIEELEKHEKHGKSESLYSGLLEYVIPKNTKRNKHDVTSVIEGELTCLRAQMKFAPTEVTQDSKPKMLQKTLEWVAAREDHNVPIGIVDEYAKNVVELLIDVQMKLPEREEGPNPGLDGQVVNNALFAIGKARNQGDRQDEQFHQDPSKEAVLRTMRHGKEGFIGARRLVNLKPDDKRFTDGLARFGIETSDLR